MDKVLIAVTCRNASGESDIPVFAVPATEEDTRDGTHYDRACELAKNSGYGGPMVCFDAGEHHAILSAAQELELVPRVVAVDFTEGLVHSVCCDAGEIKVICYDESDTDEYSAVIDLPVGENGKIVRCWAHIQTADVDPGLKKARD